MVGAPNDEDSLGNPCSNRADLDATAKRDTWMEPSRADIGATLHDKHVITSREERIFQKRNVKDGMRSLLKLPVDELSKNLPEVP